MVGFLSFSHWYGLDTSDSPRIYEGCLEVFRLAPKLDFRQRREQFAGA
jgi:hypothetical protein